MFRVYLRQCGIEPMQLLLQRRIGSGRRLGAHEALVLLGRELAMGAAIEERNAHEHQHDENGGDGRVIETAVEAAEERLQKARHTIEDPAVVVDAVRLTEALTEMESAQTEADQLYARWAELTEKAG